MERHLILLGGWSLSLWIFANGIFAVARPSEWLRARWTATRGFRRDAADSSDEIAGARGFGVWMIAGGAVFVGAILEATISEFSR